MPTKMPTKKQTKARLARLQTISEIVAQQIRFARFSSSFKHSDIVKGIAEECVSLCIAEGMLEHRVNPAAVITVTRCRLRKEWKEIRWVENKDGKEVRRSKDVLRFKHPVELSLGEDGDGQIDHDGTTWSIPMDEVCADLQGNFCGSSASIRNNVEERMLERLDAIARQMKLIDIVGTENWDWLLRYVNDKHPGRPSKVNQDKFGRLAEILIQADRRHSSVEIQPRNRLEQAIRTRYGGVMTTKLTKQEMAAIDKGPRTKRETEQWVALFERGLASGQLTLGKMSRKEQLKFREELVLTFWQLGEMEKGSLVIRLRALEELSQIVSTAKTRLLEKAAVAGGSHE